MDLTTYFNSLSGQVGISERQQFIKKIAEITGKSEIAVRRWCEGKNNPTLLEKQAIAKFLNRPFEDLFPKSQEVDN
ncbi:XRE family transcriptional regulator [Paludibacter sp. 221]|uniref:helix-turn-helix domain-containing protein n=1 Tax=Paludibacter sp. 221 TaxID=2302939 RepID=UPI0013D3121F|nr:helix-turn-helix transcriptional regulator [Paludibacter sp. 221]NDV45829.1 XRE family transcriptional regulator [Paludibacter sp. 221]